MANEKILNTRIRLKYDSFSNWNTKNPVLLKGEIAIAYLGPTKTDAEPDNGTHPILFKVGPGEFNSLPWASALAADVYAWAKEDKLFVAEPVGEGNAITSVSWDSTLNSGKGGFKAEKGATFATKAELEAAIAAFGGDLSSIKDNDHIYQFTIPTEGDHAGKLAVTETITVNGETSSTATTYYDFVTPGELDVILGNYYTKEEIDEIIGGLDESETEVAGSDYIKVDDSITEGNDHSYTVSLKLDEVKEALGLKTEGIAAFETVESLNATAKGYADAVLGTANDDIGANTVYGANKAAEKAQTTIDTFLASITPDGAENIIDTLQEINDYVGEHGEEFAALSNRVAGLEGGVDGWNAAVQSADFAGTNFTKTGTHLSISKDDARAALGLGGAADKAVDFYATAEALEHVVDGTTPVAKAVNADKLGNVEAANYALKTDIKNGTFTVAAAADGALSGSGSMSANQEGDTSVSLDVKEKGIATKHIADKAVGAEQVKAYASAERETSEEVWVFYCGDASFLVD